MNSKERSGSNSVSGPTRSLGSETPDPVHIAIIPDGNRRWARERGLDVLKGHERGIRVFRNLLKWVKETDIKYVSAWAFSTENFGRDEQEVNGLFRLFEKTAYKALESSFKEMDYKVKFIGELGRFPESVTEMVSRLEDKYSTGSRQVNILLGYGGRAELLAAVNRVISDVKAGKIDGQIDESVFRKYLYTDGIPDPDLIIRTSGEMRLSGLMPWQAVYSELYFSKKLWPDFTKSEFMKILSDYKNRKRRFGR